MQAMAKKPPKCPGCGSELDCVTEITEESWVFDPETGTYKLDKLLVGSLEVLCPYCRERLDDWEDLGFAEGACNYPHGRI